MSNQDSKTHDLFLLMINLSQLKSMEKIVDVFTGAFDEIWTGISAEYHERVNNRENCIGIRKHSTSYFEEKSFRQGNPQMF